MKNSKVVNNIVKYLLILVSIIVILSFISIKSDIAFNIIGIRPYTVLSGSMKPEMDPGDVVFVTNRGKNDLNEGDIITFYENNTIITHRIVEITKEGYTTKGDNNNSIDIFTVKQENIIGKVLFHIPKIGYLIELLSRPIVIAIEMILLAGLIIKSCVMDK